MNLYQQLINNNKPNSSPSAALPKNIGRFQIIRELGKGSQGLVYLAKDPQLERNVAIKTLHIQFKQLKEKQAMLFQEARTVSRLSHPNIIPIYEAGEFEDRPYLVFEFIDGISLKEYLKKNGPLPISRSLELMNQILAGISNAHENNVLHGDLSPRNILMDKNAVPRIMDFGIARFIGSNQSSSYGLWGSLVYMSPEHFNNSPLTEKSDIFALGLILFEMLINQQIIEGDNDFAIINAIANHPIAPPSVRNPVLGKEINEIVMRALEKEPNARYASAMDMHKAIDDYLEKEQQQTTNSGDSKNITIDFLIRKMKFKMDFPILSQHIMEVSNKAENIDQTSIADLANTILSDYGLTTKLLKLVNSPYYRRTPNKISTISRAVALLGFEQVRTAALGLILMEHVRNGTQRDELKDNVIAGFLNGVIGKDVAEKIKFKAPEEAFICSMFHNIGHLLTIYYFPEEYEEIKNLVEKNGINEESAVKSILGLTYYELGQGITKFWEFPEKITDSITPLPEGKIKKPSSDADVLTLVSNFSTELTKAVTGSLDRRHDKVKDLVNRFGVTLPVNNKNVEQLISNATSNVRKYADALNIRLDNSVFFKRWTFPLNAPHGAASANLTNTTINQEKYDALEDSPEKIMLDSIQEISNALLENYNLNEILITILETIYRGFNFSHVLFCVMDKDRVTVHARYGFGKDIDKLTNGMKISLKNKPDIFNIAISEGRDLIIENIEDRSFAEFIPNWFRSLVPARSVVIYPILVKGIPIGLIYADHNQLGSVGSKTPLNLFKTLRNQAVMAIKQKASR